MLVIALALQGLRETGVFNDECKWAVLRQQVWLGGWASKQSTCILGVCVPRGR